MSNNKILIELLVSERIRLLEENDALRSAAKEAEKDRPKGLHRINHQDRLREFAHTFRSLVLDCSRRMIGKNTKGELEDRVDFLSENIGRLGMLTRPATAIDVAQGWPHMHHGRDVEERLAEMIALLEGSRAHPEL